VAGKVTAGLAESNGSLPQGGLTACTPGSAPGPTLSNEYGKPLPFYCRLTINNHKKTLNSDERQLAAYTKPHPKSDKGKNEQRSHNNKLQYIDHGLSQPISKERHSGHSQLPTAFQLTTVHIHHHHSRAKSQTLQPIPSTCGQFTHRTHSLTQLCPATYYVCCLLYKQ